MSRRRGAAFEGVVLAAFLALITTLTVAAFFTREWRPPVASQHGTGVDRMISYLLVVTGIVFVVGHAVLIAFIVRYRRGREKSASIPRRAEWVWTLVPVAAVALFSEVGVIVIGLPVWASVYGEPPANTFTVEVTGKQFEWLVRYPGKDGKFGRVDPKLVNDAENPLGLDEKDPASTDDVILRGTMHLPVDRPVQVRIRSLDVLHSFSLPELRVKQDAVPGYTTGARFTPTKAGKYEIACAELCGLGHYRMRGYLFVKSAKDFEEWMADQQGWYEE
jgi:cytochrome c oxidase subunit 2